MSVLETTRADGTKSRLQNRVEAARSLADELADQGQARMAQVIRDLCNSALQSARTNSQLYGDLAALRSAPSVEDPSTRDPATDGSQRSST